MIESENALDDELISQCARLLHAQLVATGAVEGLQEHDNEICSGIVLADEPFGVLVAGFFNLFLREVGEGMAGTRYGLRGGIDDDSAAAGFGIGCRCHKPK